MKKRALSLFLALCLALTLCTGVGLPVSAQTYSGGCGAEGDNLTWSFDPDLGLLTIEGSGAMADYGSGEPNPPWYDFRDEVQAVQLPEGLTSVGRYAFFGAALTELTIPDSVTSLNGGSFYLCVSLERVRFGAGTKYIEYNAFYRCDSLTEIILPAGLLAIGDHAFAYCRQLDRAMIPDSVTTIGNRAFYECSSLLEVTIPPSVTDIGTHAFGYRERDGMDVTLDYFLIYCWGGAAWSYANENGLPYTTPQGEDMAHLCGRYGGNLSWSYDSNRNRLTVSGSGSMDDWQIDWSVYAGTVDDHYDPLLCNTPWFPDSPDVAGLSLPDGLTHIGSCAFLYCEGLTQVTIPDTVTDVGAYAFANCCTLEQVTIPDSVTAIGESAFANCSTLEQVTIPDSVTAIAPRVFFNCDALTEMTIPERVTEIGAYAFADCGALERVTIPASVTDIGENAFDGAADGFTIYGDPDTAAEAYAIEYGIPFVPLNGSGGSGSVGGSCGEHLTWSFDPDTGLLTIEGSGAMEDFLTGSGDCVNERPWGQYCDQITAVVMPEGMTRIGSCAFLFCTNLTEVWVPSTVSAIGTLAFSDCDSLTGAYLQDGLTALEDGAFCNCGALETIWLPDTVTEVGDYVFFNCRSLYGVQLSAGLEAVGRSMFQDCGALSWIEIPAGVQYVLDNAFCGCSSLNWVELPDTVTHICENAFCACPISWIELPDSVTCVGDCAFLGCDSLYFVRIPAGVTEIGSRAFGYDQAGMPIDYFQICGYPGSAGEAYALENGFPFVLAEDAVLTGTFGEDLSWTLTLQTGLLTIEGSGPMPTDCWGPGDYPWDAYRDRIAAVSLPEGLTTIGSSAFIDCWSLNSVTIPAGVNHIGEQAFGWFSASDAEGTPWCSSSFVISGYSGTAAELYAAHNGFRFVSLGSHLPSGSFGEDLSWTLDPATGLLTVAGCGSMGERYAMDGAPWQDYTEWIRKVVLLDGVADVCEYAFSECAFLTAVTLPDSVTAIGAFAFADCESLRSVTIPAAVTDIGSYAFGYVWYDQKVEGFTVYGWTGTAAQRYAAENEFPFIPLDDAVGGFTDVAPGAYYAASVLWAVENGITAGTGVHEFSPNKPCTRAQIMTFLWSAAGKPEPARGASPFEDVPESAYYYKAVLWAVQNGITSGTSAASFSPNAVCSRAQAVTFLWLAAGKPSGSIQNPFADVRPSSWYYEAVLWAVENGITAGTGQRTFSPGKDCTRGQIVTFLFAALADET